MQNEGIFLKRNRQNSNFLTTHTTQIKFSEKIIEDKDKKNSGHQNEGVLIKRVHQNSNFLTTHTRHLKFSGLATIKQI